MVVVNEHLTATQQERDGGYYAVKGFLYQFDLTIMKILENPDCEISFENQQDIDYEEFVIQVKHKETQVYQPSKIKAPVIQLLKLFDINRSKTFCLYCHFKDTPQHDKQLSLEELNTILGKEGNSFSTELKNYFIKSFTLKFLHDYEQTFINLIEKIKTVYRLKARNESLIYHSIFRSEILRLVIKEKKFRILNKLALDELIKKTQDIVFHSVYDNYLTKDSYEDFIRKTFFTQRTPNLQNFERLFIIDTSGYWDLTDLQSVIYNISNKYYRKEKSPAPYICFQNINKDTLNIIKQDLIDAGLSFCDGTYFNGDKFRLDKLITNNWDNKVKFIDREFLEQLVKSKNIQEIYQFYTESNFEINTNYKHIKVQLNDITQVNKILK
ncbi:hypothetical protein H1D32_21075 [Anaerobacillus sp. CMMVII]|uniref:hypothetical protein n=1 Tax=Anaerobacillus sp. CMMVII TaxID=2755588 RepID=UPI0021B6F985|nr:hypothetical protein [Anaerobacillus sp. CMMVII]MCT8139971.1 hypothetical protein [Anaerobacillus sp. CMMVII]